MPHACMWYYALTIHARTKLLRHQDVRRTGLCAGGPCMERCTTNQFVSPCGPFCRSRDCICARSPPTAVVVGHLDAPYKVWVSGAGGF